MFVEAGIATEAVQSRVDAIFNQLFFGDAKTEAVYFEVGDGTAYIMDVGDNDVRSEGMSYGMAIAAQRGNRTMFDQLWKWAQLHMRHNDPDDPRYGYFAWHCTSAGQSKDPNPASDGETYFATALYTAGVRWSDPSYTAAADNILEIATNKTGISSVVPMFANNTGVAAAQQQVVFVPYASSASFTDPSYHLPAFYELWAASAATQPGFWASMTNSARNYFHLAANPTLGLAPDYSTFGGKLTGSQSNFAFDAWRVAMNVAMDYAWFAADSREVALCNNLQAFFQAQNSSGKPYGNQYNPQSGQQLSGDHSPGLVVMNAVCSLAATDARAWDFVLEAWNTPTPTGHWRYYDGMLYMLGWLHLSGNFKYYGPSGPVPPVPPPPVPPPTPSNRCADPGSSPNCNVCAECCHSYIPTQAACDRCVSEKCLGPSPSPPAPPSGNITVQFSRNGKCVGIGPNGAVNVQGCYVHSSKDRNLWKYLAGEPLMAVALGDAQQCVTDSGCEAGVSLSVHDDCLGNSLQWSTSQAQLVLNGCSQLCAGDGENDALQAMSCDDMRAQHWQLKKITPR